MFRASPPARSTIWSRPWGCRAFLGALCEDIDGKVNAFLDRPIKGDWPYLWIDATYLKVRRGGRIVSVATIIAVAVNTDCRCAVRDRRKLREYRCLMHLSLSAARAAWAGFT